MHRPQFPIGPLEITNTITIAQRDAAIIVLQTFPEELKQLTHNLSDAQLNKPYRDGSWTIRQLVHHIADSHNHCYNRIRWTLTEDSPKIKAYNQDAYAMMQDYKTMPIAISLLHIEVIHKKLVQIFNSLTNKEMEKYFVHPETNNKVTVKEMVLTYAWHSKHHLAHIKNAL